MLLLHIRKLLPVALASVLILEKMPELVPGPITFAGDPLLAMES